MRRNGGWQAAGIEGEQAPVGGGLHPAVGRVLLRGLEAIGIILAGLLMYAVALRLACRLAGVSLYTGSYNSITNLLSEGTRSHLGQNLPACC